MINFTQGPWIDYKTFIKNFRGERVLFCSESMEVNKEFWRWHPEAKGNAELALKAPELLDALEFVMDRFVSIDSKDEAAIQARKIIASIRE